MSSRHSTWPVLLCVYNLPPWLCMKRKYIMMSLLIQGPKQPGNDIDVYLEPLIEDMKTLWNTGVEVYDAYAKDNFLLRAMIFCTISDFPAYGNLSGYGTKGYKACPVCEDDTHSKWLPNCRKMVYMGHRRSLRKNHPYRKRKKLFDGNNELGVLRQPLDGEAVLSRVRDVNNVTCKSDIALMLCTSRKMFVILPDRIRHTITKLCLFFNMIHSKVIDPEVLDEWQSDIILTLCQLEMYFPPSFFDVMVHLVSHIVREIKACGPTFQRNMYPFERYMGFLKGHVRNRYRPEASIIQGYATEEVIEFCTDYMKDVPSIGVPQSRHEGKLQGVGTIGRNMEPPNQDDLYRAHFTVFEHMTCVAPFLHEQKTMTVERLGFGLLCVTKYQGYDINGYTFYTKQQDEKSTFQNSGVMLIAAMPEFSMGDHEARSTIAKKSYYGVIQEIWELDYLSFTIPMLKCKWVNNEGGLKVDDYGFTSVNLSTNGYTYEPFILAKQANQIFFVEDPSDSRWHIVLQGKRRIVGVENVVDEDEYDEFDELPPFSIGDSSSNDVIDDTTYLRSDHDEDMNEQPEPQPQPQRKKRGIYSLKKKNRKQLNGVTFDENGFAIGDDQSPFALYIGAVTKAKISILIDDWRKVSKINKTQLWLEIKAFKSNQTGNKKIVAANTSTQTATKQIVATNKDSSTQKQTSPNLSRQEGPSNYIAAAPPTKRARPLNSLPIYVTLDRGSLFFDQTLPYLDLGTCKLRGVGSFALERVIELDLDAGFFVLV
ncbi:transposon protein, CACTA, En/Spm sub-class [Tanacetum coccineum]